MQLVILLTWHPDLIHFNVTFKLQFYLINTNTVYFKTSVCIHYKRKVEEEALLVSSSASCGKTLKSKNHVSIQARRNDMIGNTKPKAP